jgi:hypothetical protein
MFGNGRCRLFCRSFFKVFVDPFHNRLWPLSLQTISGAGIWERIMLGVPNGLSTQLQTFCDCTATTAATFFRKLMALLATEAAGKMLVP